MLPTRRSILHMATALASPARPARWQGTFLQLWAAHKEWPDERWAELFGYLRGLGLREIVVQWSRYDNVGYGAEVQRVLAAGFDVWMGLAYDSRWWEQASPEMVRDAAGGISPVSGVRGYYLPQEIEDGTWLDSQRFTGLAAAIREVRKQFHPLAVSGFTNSAGSPAGLARFWTELQRRSKFDRLLFQDGIGSGKMTLADWPEWAAPLAKRLNRRFSVVVEAFTAHGEGAAWKAEPADLSRIERQLQAAASISRNPIVAFSAPEYLTPLGGEAAARLYQNFRRPLD